MTMPNFPYHLARWRGDLSRRAYRARLSTLANRAIISHQSIPIDVFAYSGEAALPEQVVSIRSFLRYAGRPRQFTIVSDGSYSPASRALLQSIDPCVRVREVDDGPPELPEKAQTYIRSHPTGRQLGLIMSLPVEHPALYVDSDVRFFPGAVDLRHCLETPHPPAYYLADCQFSGDRRLLRDLSEEKSPVNTGVLLLFERLDWSLSIQRLLELEGAPDFFTNQTITHLTMHQNGALPFDPNRYVLQLDDQFIFSDLYARDSLVLRHYVNPVRHKFWTTLKY